MSPTDRLAGRIAFVVCGALFGALSGCATYVEQPRAREVYVPAPPPPVQVYAPPPPVYVAPPPVYVAPPPVFVQPAVDVSFAIHTENDFYEPLTPYGRWEVVGGYGRCWIPNRVEADWRPYSNGNWQRTEAGWYWASDEPWAWATYHYGRWDFNGQYGWYWVPQTQWAPAWVSWHRGGGYLGWAPLQPAARIQTSGLVEVNVALIAPRAFVFVEERHFTEPVRPATVVVNNTTIINKTVNITNIKVVNNTVINEGPRTTIIEQASGEKVQSVPVHELRRKQEAQVVARQRIAAPIEAAPRQPQAVSTPEPRSFAKPVLIEPATPVLEKPVFERPREAPGSQRILTPVVEDKFQPPVRSEAPPRQPQAVSAPESRPIVKPALITEQPAAPEKPLQRARVQPISAPAETKAELKHEPKLPARPQIITTPKVDEKVQPPIRSEVAPRPTTVPALGSRPTERPAVISHEPIAPGPDRRQPERSRGQPVPTPAEAKLGVSQEAKPGVNRGAERPGKEKQGGNKKSGGTDTNEKGRQKKNEEPRTPPENPAAPR